MIRFRSINFILTLALVAIMLVFIAVTMISSLVQRHDEILNRGIEDIKQEVAAISRTAENLLLVYPQLLDDDVTQSASDPRVSLVAVVNHQDTVISATNFAWLGKSAATSIPIYDSELIKQARDVKTAIVQQFNAGNQLLAIMSFTEPSAERVIRYLNKGVIILVYDLTEARDKVLKSVLFERSIDILVIIIATLLLIFLVNRYINRPLSLLQRGVQQLAEGEFNQPIIPQGPKEIVKVTEAFNHMTNQLAESFRKIESQSKHTETILENVIDGIITIDTKGRIRSFNFAAEKIFRYSAQAVIGKNVKMLMPEPYTSQHDNYLTSYLAGNPPRIIGQPREVSGLRSNGEIFPMDLAVNEIEIDGEKNFIGIVRDITERKKIEQLKNEFISTVSHELRTPLTALNGAIGLVVSGKFGELSQQNSQLIDTAKRNADRLLNLINDLLDMEKILAGKMQFEIANCDLQEIINEALVVNSTYAEQYKVKFTKSGYLLPVNIAVDSKRLEQVLSNFLSNACKFSNPGSIVEIVVQQLNRKIKVSVVDKGMGIPDEFKKNLFQKFTQADASVRRKRGGTGLGLSISKELIERMGGQVGFESTVGKGSEFYFEFPLK